MRLKTTSVEHPATNGQTELANRIILKGLKKRLDNAKGRWVDELPSVLWSYRVTKQTATKETPYALAYGCEAMIPAEIGATSDRVLYYEEQQNQAQRQASLDISEEMRETALIRMAAYKQKIANYFNTKVKKRTLHVGDLVLREVANNRVNPSEGKLGPNWEGPYRIYETLPGGAYRLETMGGNHLPNPWNIAKLKKYLSP